VQDLVIIIILALLLYVLPRGFVKVFVANFWLAIIMLLLIPPLFLLWIIFEGIT